jgi:hypothetical protein
VQGFLANPCTCETLCLVWRLVVSGSSSMTATFLNCHQDMFTEKFPQKKPSVGYSLRSSPWQVWVWDVSLKFLRRKHLFGYCLSETNIVWLLYFLCVSQSEETMARFQVEAPWAYQCKKILGLCHSPPKIENRVVCGKSEVKTLSTPTCEWHDKLKSLSWTK